MHAGHYKCHGMDYSMYWKSAGDGLQKYWEYLYDDVFHGNEFSLVVGGTMMYGAVAFIAANMPFLIVDFTGWPMWLVYRRIQPERKFTMSEFWQVIKMVALNIGFTLPLGFLTFYFVGLWRGSDFGRTLPDFSVALVQFLLAFAFYDLLSYWEHRFLHLKWLYQSIHKHHHHWKAPICLQAWDTNPLEFYLNFATFFCVPLLMGCHLSVVWLIAFYGILGSVFTHCGYHTPILTDAQYHDAHHEYFNCNYGTFAIWDMLFGTYKLNTMEVREKRRQQKE